MDGPVVREVARVQPAAVLLAHPFHVSTYAGVQRWTNADFAACAATPFAPPTGGACACSLSAPSGCTLAGARPQICVAYDLLPPSAGAAGALKAVGFRLTAESGLFSAAATQSLLVGGVCDKPGLSLPTARDSAEWAMPTGAQLRIDGTAIVEPFGENVTIDG